MKQKQRWRRETLTSSNGDVQAWELGGYWLYLNVNHGKEPPVAGKGQVDRHGNLWWFEVYAGGPDGRYVGEAPTLKSAKEIAYADEKEPKAA